MSFSPEGEQQTKDLGRFRISAEMFEQFCSGVVDLNTVAVLEKSQYSLRRLALRALIDQLAANPGGNGPLVDPEQAWWTLAAAEQRDAEAVADILLYPTVGVWLTRALHYTRRDRPAGWSWSELGYLQLVAAAAAIRCGLDRTIRVPVWHGVVTLPTVGQFRLPGPFPVGTAEVICAGQASRLRVRGGDLAGLGSPAFTPARRHVARSREQVLCVWLEDRDPYRGFGDPRPPLVRDDTRLAEWRKLVDEAWDVLTRYHATHARELAGGVRALVPIDPGSDVVGSSSPSAFGGIGLSGNGSAAELAEAMVHEFQHSKLNALLDMVELVDGDLANRCYAPWRDDPRPLVGLVHGVVAFTAGVEFWARQRNSVVEQDLRGVEFSIGLRRLQVRRTTEYLQRCGRLTSPGRVLIGALSHRLLACEQEKIDPQLSHLADQLVDDHRALWRLKFLRPARTAVQDLADAWMAKAAAGLRTDQGSVMADDGRRLPADRRNLLRVKVLEPDLFESLRRRPTSLPGNTPLADVQLCAGNHREAGVLYRDRVLVAPSETQAWVGLGIALRGQGSTRASMALLERPEITVAAYQQVRLLTGEQPDPEEFADWLGAAL
jgi:HEXXH motif-containing protein